jgi:hypothetical protein
MRGKRSVKRIWRLGGEFARIGRVQAGRAKEMKMARVRLSAEQLSMLIGGI